MDFSILNKVVGAEKKPQQQKDFDIEVFFSKTKGLDKFFNMHLMNDSNPLIDAIDEIDRLITIHQVENNMSLTLMLKEF